MTTVVASVPQRLMAADTMNFEYEPPTQALWLTHPQHGITISMPVYLDDNAHKPPVADAEWISWRT